MHQVIGKFKIQKQIGIGTTSTVYLGLDELTGKKVAIKITRQDVFDETEHGETCRKMFINEAAFAGRLHHPNIVAVLDAGMQGHDLYTIMEYVEGNNLKHYCFADKLLPVEQVVHIIFNCCNAMNYAFKKGVIHRDIKPANIILQYNGNIKITDFGSALLGDIEMSQISQLVGSPAYIAPEVVFGKKATCQSDIYSLGVTMYQLLTGQLPFLSKKTSTLLHQILHDQPIPIESVRKEIPSAFVKIVNKAIHKDKKIRYLSWNAFARDIKKAIQHTTEYPPELHETEHFNLLKKLNFFSGFSDIELWELMHFSTWIDCPMGIRLVKEGSQGNAVFVLISGSAKVTKKDRLLGTIMVGEPIGEMSYISKTTRTASVYTMDNSTLIKFTMQDLKRASKDLQIAISNALLRVLTLRLQKTSEFVLDLQQSNTFDFTEDL